MVVIKTIANTERHCLTDGYNANAFAGTFAFFLAQTNAKKSKRASKQTHQDTDTMDRHNTTKKNNEPLTACKQYCPAAGATQGNIAYTQNVMGKI